MFDQYAPYIYAAYGVSALCLIVLTVSTVRRWWRARKGDQTSS